MSRHTCYVTLSSFLSETAIDTVNQEVFAVILILLILRGLQSAKLICAKHEALFDFTEELHRIREIKKCKIKIFRQFLQIHKNFLGYSSSQLFWKGN